MPQPLLQAAGPAVGVLRRAPLDSRKGIVELLGQGAGLEVVDGIDLIAVGQLADGADDRGGTDAHGLLQRAVLRRLKQLVHRDEALLGGRPPIPQKLEAGPAGNARQDRSGEHGRDDLAARF